MHSFPSMTQSYLSEPLRLVLVKMKDTISEEKTNMKAKRGKEKEEMVDDYNIHL